MRVYIHDLDGSKGIFEVDGGYTYDEIYQALVSMGIGVQRLLYSVK